ncbi:polysaccharide biosynthesis tyrosine autokinase [uncultured Serinicoccus sp.]|uniref:polysaccharide biosynthesis tyrosine autokinase n=1 Tax=uncultured Serinicoccus sp. TaxID=735514 RepID=UPI002635A946|nr:polysaccharide biosynthesis tyrosine autokinase [uncultured Serinicoccus sp.]
MELKDYLLALKERWWLVVLMMVLGVGAAVAVTAASPRVYEAQTELFVAPDTGTTSAELAQGSSYVLDRVKSYVRVIDRELVLGPVIDDLGLDTTVADLSEDVDASVVEETVVVQITARADSPAEAADLADAVATEFRENAAQLEPQRGEDGGSVVRVTVIDSAREPQSPVSPQPVLNLALGLLVGTGAGVAAAVMRQALDRRVRGEEDAKALTGVPMVGQLPLDADTTRAPLALGEHLIGPRAEALRQVRTNLQFLDLPSARRSYVITSSLPGEGKSVTALSLAATLAEAGQRVCYVEADLRQGSAAHYLSLEGAVGLTHVLIGAAELDDVLQPASTNLDVVLAGAVPPNPSELLSSDAMDSLLRRLEADYDVVLVDAPPLLPVTDAAILAKRCRGALLIVALGRKAVDRQELADAVEILRTVDADLLGFVINKAPRRGPNRSHAYIPYGGETTTARHAVPRARRQGMKKALQSP